MPLPQIAETATKTAALTCLLCGAPHDARRTQRFERPHAYRGGATYTTGCRQVLVCCTVDNLTLFDVEGVGQDGHVAEFVRHAVGGSNRVHNSCLASPVLHLLRRLVIISARLD